MQCVKTSFFLLFWEIQTLALPPAKAHATFPTQGTYSAVSSIFRFFSSFIFPLRDTLEIPDKTHIFSPLFSFRVTFL